MCRMALASEVQPERLPHEDPRSPRRSPTPDRLLQLLQEELNADGLLDLPEEAEERNRAEVTPAPANNAVTDIAQARGGVGIAGGPPPGPRSVSSTAAGPAGIRVAVRVRPLAPGEPSIIEVVNQGAVAIRKEAATGGNEYLASQQGRTEERSFDRVFGPTSTQAEVYAWSCRPLVEAAVAEGRSATVLVYGATGAGKTHTMFGERELEEQGLIYRAVRDIFVSVEKRCEGSSSSSSLGPPLDVSVSFLELYNEKLYDLLQEGREGSGGAPCSIMEDERRGLVKIANLKLVQVRSAQEALQQLHSGLQLRKVDSTAANLRSSRSHAVFELRLERRGPDGRQGEADDRRLHSKICLIDLAGSERASQTQNTGAALREGAKINQSLLALANCINALGERSRNSDRPPVRDKTPQRKPPYRDSKLTLLLKSSLVSDGMVSMIANVHPGRDHFEDSNNTLEYAKRTTTVSRPSLVRLDQREASVSVPAARRNPTQPSPPPSPIPGQPRFMPSGQAQPDPKPLGPEGPPRPRKKSASRPSGENGNAGPAARRLPPLAKQGLAWPGTGAAEGGGGGGGGLRSHSEGPQARVVADAILRGRPTAAALDELPRQQAQAKDMEVELAEPTSMAAARAGFSPGRMGNRLHGRARSVPHAPAAIGQQRPQRPDGVNAMLAGMRGIGMMVVEGPPPTADPQVLLRIVESLQAEKAAMNSRLDAIMEERDRLEVECGRLRAANFEKDQQLALILGGMGAPSSQAESPEGSDAPTSGADVGGRGRD